MVEARLRVETTENRHNNNPFYGNTLVKKVTEETFYHDKFENTEIAPCGIKGTLVVKDKYAMDISVNRYMLEYEGCTDGLTHYLAYFTINDKVYELCVWFWKDELDHAVLSEWNYSSDFESGEDEDNTYHSKGDFITFESFL